LLSKSWVRTTRTFESVTLPVSWLLLPSSCSGRSEDRPIEIGTAAIDTRYENPIYMAEDAGAADLSPAGACSSVSVEARLSR